MSVKEPSADFLNAIINVNDEYLRDDSLLFQDESANRAEIFKAASRFAIKRKKVRTCIVPSCTSRSIPKSHTIQRTSLECIADNGHVLAPKAAQRSNRIEMIRLGVNRASVFPGFCATHEGMFQQFERVSRIQSSTDLSLQLYRSVCREIVRFRIDIESMREIVDDYLEFRRRQLEHLYRQRVPDQIFSLTEVRASDVREAEATRWLTNTERHLASFQKDFEPAALAGLSNPDQGLCTCAVIVDENIPVCLSGHGNFHIKTKQGLHNVRALLLVLPQRRDTVVSISVLQRDRHHLARYLRQFAGPLGLLCMIESWMIHGTDHWFISPKVWTSIDPGIRRNILDDILDVSRNIGSFYRHTVFNELKRRTIGELEETRRSPA